MFGLRCHVSLAVLATAAFALPQRQQRADGLLPCGGAFYYADKVRVNVRLFQSGRITDGFVISTFATKAISCVQFSMASRR
jgi:hypothetical protein